MANRKANLSDSNILFDLVLIILLLLIASTIWVIVPRLAEDYFGPSSKYLSSSQKWTYSLKVLSAKKNLISIGCTSGQNINFTINYGDSISTISSNLQSAGIIKDSESFRNYLIYKGYDTDILASDYALNCTKTPLKIAEDIKNGYQKEVLFVILPGWRSEEIANALATSGLNITTNDFLAVVKNPTGIELPGYIPSGSSLEGFLFPGEYTVSREITATQLVQTFINRFDEQITQSGISLTPNNGLDFYHSIILASIIQRESYNADERPLIASVFYNRLLAGMKLETDPTVQYALGYSDQWGWWKSPLSSEDLTVDSVYNTYQITGLPPTPIANPDLSSIQAAENPQVSDYYYFRAKCDGSGTHSFAKTLEEQIANECK